MTAYAISLPASSIAPLRAGQITQLRRPGPSLLRRQAGDWLWVREPFHLPREHDALAPIQALLLHPATWLGQLQRAQTPKPHTIARVQALIAGGPVPPAPPNNFQKPTLRRASVLPREGKIDGADNLPRVDREPCPRCGVRRDIGCHHTARAVSSRIPL